MGKGKSENVTSTQESKTELPDWVNSGGKKTFSAMSRTVGNLVKNPALTPAQIAAGKTYVAPLNQDHMDAIDAVRDRAFSHDDYFAPGQDFQRKWNMSAFGSRSIDPETGQETLSFAPYNAETMAQFQNPWDQQVLDTSLADMARQREIDRIRQEDDAIAAGAFGGTGRAVESAELSRNWADKMGQLESQLRQAGFLNAQNQFNTERNAAMQGWDRETSERATGADVGAKKQTADLTGAAALKGAGDWQRDIEQAGLDAAGRVRLEPMELYKQLAATLGMTPTGSTTSGSSTTPEAQPDRLGQAIGAGSSILGAFLMSDEKRKKNITPADDEGEEALTAFSKLPISNFEYDDEAVEDYGQPTGPRVGPMAQDYQQQFGGDGKTIDIGNAIGQLMLAVKALEQRTRAA